MRKSYSVFTTDQELGRRIVRRLLIFSLLLLLLSQAAISLFAWSSLEEKLAPELDKQAATVGRLINNKFQKALDYKIPFEKIQGMKEFFDDIREENSDMRFLAISNSAGKVLTASGIAEKTLGEALKNAPASNAAIRTIKTRESSGRFRQKSYLIYLVPLLLTDFSSTTSEIGRYAMTYGIAALLLSPVFAKVADRYQAHVAMVACGGLLTGIGLVPFFFIADKTLVLLGIAALGIGQAMSISAQITLVGRLTQMDQLDSGSVLGVFRLIERLGAAAGPLIAGALVALFGLIPAVTALGLYSLLSTLCFALVFFEKKHATVSSTDENSERAFSQNGGLQ